MPVLSVGTLRSHPDQFLRNPTCCHLVVMNASYIDYDHLRQLYCSSNIAVIRHTDLLASNSSLAPAPGGHEIHLIPATPNGQIHTIQRVMAMRTTVTLLYNLKEAVVRVLTRR